MSEATLEAPARGAYLPEPEYTEDQDEPGNVLMLARGFVQPSAPRTFAEALGWLANQSLHRSQDWTGLCQRCMRMSDGCGGGFASALAQWFGMPGQYRFVGGSPADAPIGADLFSRSNDPDSSSFVFGHIIKKARPFSNGRMGAWSTDALRVGQVDKINPPDLYDRWDHEYLGWGYNINGLVIDVKDPKPVQDKPYQGLENAIVSADEMLTNLRRARKVAFELGDKHDAELIDMFVDRVIEVKQRAKTMSTTLLHK